MKTFSLSILFLLFISSNALAQGGFGETDKLDPVQWTFDATEHEKGQYELILTASIADGWYLYSQHIDDGGPIPTSFHFEESKKYKVDKTVDENGPFIESFDGMFEMDIKKYKEQAQFRVKVTPKKEETTVKGYLEFMTCDDQKCLPPAQVPFEITLP